MDAEMEKISYPIEATHVVIWKKRETEGEEEGGTVQNMFISVGNF